MLAAHLRCHPDFLSRKFKAAGVAMEARDPLGRLTSPGIYTVDFGSRR